MRIGRLFAVSMLSVTALAVVLGAEVLFPQARTYADKTEAIRAVKAFGAVLAVGQQVAAHRAPYLTPLFQDAAATPAQLDAIAKTVQATDAAIADARAAIGGLSDSGTLLDGLNQAAAKLAEIRSASDRALNVPSSARDMAVTKGFMPGIAQVVAIIEPVLNYLESDVAAADASLSALLSVARTAQDFRISAGGRAGTMSPALSAHRPLTSGEFTAMDRAQGRVEFDRERIEAGIDQLDHPPKLTKALKDAIDAYFGRAVQVIEKEMPAARSDGKYSISSDELAAAVVPAVQSFFVVRDAALVEAAERAQAARAWALMMLGLAAAAVAALLGVLAGVTMMLRRRVIAPLGAVDGCGRRPCGGPARSDDPDERARRRNRIDGCFAAGLQGGAHRQEGSRRGRRGGGRCENPARPARGHDYPRFRSDDRRDRRHRVIGLHRTGSFRRHADGDRRAFGGADHHGRVRVRRSLRQCAVGRIRDRRDGIVGQRDQPPGAGLGAHRRRGGGAGAEDQ